MGRFMSPDPGNAGADPSNPQSWNMYSYVMNNPLTLTDPTGMFYNPGVGDGGDDGGLCDPFYGCGIGIGIGMGMCGGHNCDDRQPPIYTPPATQNKTDPDPSAGDPDPDGPFSGPIWQEGGPQIPTGNLAELLGVPDPPMLIFDNNGAGGGVAAPTFGGRMVCAANTANQYSLADVLGTNGKPGFLNSLSNGFFGNTISTLVSFAYGNNWLELGGTTYDLELKASESAVDAATAPSPISQLGLTEQVSGEIAGKGFGAIFTAVKVGYDLASFIYSFGKCEQ